MGKVSYAALAATVLLGATALTPIGANAATLVEELNALLLSHPQIEGARENAAAADEGIGRAFGDFLPKARATGSFGYENIDSPGRRSLAEGKEFSTGSASQATVTITQTIFSGFRVEAVHSSAKAQKAVADAQLESGTQGVMFEGITAYLEVLRNIRLVKLAYDTEENIMQQLNLEDERVRRGAGIAVDVLQAKSRLQIAKERRVAFEGAMKDSMSRYEQVFGTAPAAKDMVMPTPPVRPCAAFARRRAEGRARRASRDPSRGRPDRRCGSSARCGSLAVLPADRSGWQLELRGRFRRYQRLTA